MESFYSHSKTSIFVACLSSFSFLLFLPPSLKSALFFLSHHPCFDHQHLRSVFVEVALSSDRRLLTINCNSKSSSEVWLIDVNTPSLEPILVQPRQPQLLYHVEHWRCWLIILANTGPGQEYQVECAHTHVYIKVTKLNCSLLI